MTTPLGKLFLPTYLVLSIGWTGLGLVILAHGELLIGGHCIVVFGFCTVIAVTSLSA